MYESPIELQINHLHNQIVKQQEEALYREVISFVPNINKEKLLRALAYDRQQYEKGYADAMASIVHCEVCNHRSKKEDMCFTRCLLSGNPVSDNDFCSYGERG